MSQRESTGTLIEALIKLSREAGAAIMDIFATDFSVYTKDDTSPVTEADEKGEKIILAGLAKLAPGIPVVAEECASAGNIPEIHDGRFWLVDPLDGTKEFIRKGTDFTVNIALIERNEPVLGVVFAPALDKVYAGSREGGAFLEEKGERRTLQVKNPGEGTLRIVASKSHRNAETDAYLAHYPGADLVSVGSSLKFCLVAEGAADLYPRLGPTMEWDTAAGHAVLGAAGGDVFDTSLDPFRYQKADFRNGFFIARGGPDVPLYPVT